jgi:hypothetical protein
MKDYLISALGVGVANAGPGTLGALNPNPTNKTLAQIIVGYINTALWFLAVVAVGMIIYSGVLFMSSAGDPEKVKTARNTLTWAVVGVLVVALSAGIVVLWTKQVGSVLK